MADGKSGAALDRAASLRVKRRWKVKATPNVEKAKK